MAAFMPGASPPLVITAILRKRFSPLLPVLGCQKPVGSLALSSARAVPSLDSAYCQCESNTT